MTDAFSGKSILVTGGTGSFGKRFISNLIANSAPQRVVVYSRDEMKQWEMAKSYMSNEDVRFFIGDIRDRDRLRMALREIDYVVHAAATKIVPTAEYDPFECIKTNVLGCMNLVEMAIEMEVEKVVALSTDKACNPCNLYGATKLVSDKTFVAGNNYAGKKKTRFSVVRYGNVMGSRGSVIPLFLKQKKIGKLTITDPRMTRFMISLDSGIDLVNTAFTDMIGGEIFVKKIPSMNICEIASAIAPEADQEVVGIRPGEKLHEQMISTEDSPFTFDLGGHYVVVPPINRFQAELSEKLHGSLVEENFEYRSNTNVDWLSKEKFADWLAKNQDSFEAV